MIYQLNLSFSLSLLFTGFLLANIFGIITNSKNIIFLFVLGIELINCFIYSYKVFCKAPDRNTSTSYEALLPLEAEGLRSSTFFSYDFSKKSSTNKLPFFSLFYLMRSLTASNKTQRGKFFDSLFKPLLFTFGLISLPSRRSTLSNPTFGLERSTKSVKSSVSKNSLGYKTKLKNIDNNVKYKLSIIVSTIVSSLNFLKIGFEFGFFVDAFKLGS